MYNKPFGFYLAPINCKWKLVAVALTVYFFLIS